MPTLSQPPQPRSAHRRLIIFGVIVLLLAISGVLVLAVNQSAYVKSQALPAVRDNPVGDAVAVDDYTKLETYCQQQKETYITNCGYGYPEHDYVCRTQGAEKAFQDCLTTTAPEEVEAFDAALFEPELVDNGSEAP